LQDRVSQEVRCGFLHVVTCIGCAAASLPSDTDDASASKVSGNVRPIVLVSGLIPFDEAGRRQATRVQAADRPITREIWIRS
jgi:hypothetical protein